VPHLSRDHLNHIIPPPYQELVFPDLDSRAPSQSNGVCRPYTIQAKSRAIDSQVVGLTNPDEPVEVMTLLAPVCHETACQRWGVGGGPFCLGAAGPIIIARSRFIAEPCVLKSG
jgi:hypothetical protein